ncbi:MAG: TIGR02391 family protein [Ignavibacteriae bacterium]|nr:TIGR02391 family protein [Ignavibacteriota bacterium]NOG99577.1 TIGR02391 family protein [Ignavibacteriota bacterium]
MPRDTIKRIFKEGEIERISKIIGDTGNGLTGTEIGHTLRSSGIADTDPGITKWQRLYNALAKAHNDRGSGNHILGYIAKAFEPAKWAGEIDRYNGIIADLNVILAFHGLEFRDDGKFHKITQVDNLTDAEKRARKLHRILEERALHQKVFEYCNAELLENNYFHAVLEASKGVADMIRNKSDLTFDGAELVDAAFGGNDPVLKINSYISETEKSEQRGFTNLLKGLFGTFRNPTAHALRIEWNMSEIDALDLFSLVSYAFRRIDSSSKRT